TSESYTLSLHDALPISEDAGRADSGYRPRQQRLPVEDEQCQTNQVVAEPREDPDQGGPARVLADKGTGQVADAVQAEPPCEEERSEEHTSELQSRRDLV